jgi:ssDNA-binding Zn-finger/Zn-ribbon topoisomerase 1
MPYIQQCPKCGSTRLIKMLKGPGIVVLRCPKCRYTLQPEDVKE